MQNKLPRRKPDFYLGDEYFRCWQNEDHYVCEIKLKNENHIIYAEVGQFDEERKEPVRNALINRLLKDYAVK